MHDELLLQAEHYYDLRKYNKALIFANKVLAERPRYGRALYIRTLCLMSKNQYKDALESCHEANDVGYNPNVIHELFAIIYMNRKEFYSAEEHLLEALRLNPGNAAVLARYSALMHEKGSFEKSKELMTEAQQIDPLNITVLEFKMAMNKKSKVDFQNYVESADDELNKLINIGNHYLGKNNHRKAYDCFRQAFLMEPENKELLETIKELKIILNPVFFPIRIFWYLPSIDPTLFLLIILVIAFVPRLFGATSLSTILCCIFGGCVFYNGLAVLIHKLFHMKS